jgi:hypothetical protein
MACDITEKPIDDKARLQAVSLLNECYKYKMDLTTNSVVITDAIKFVKTNKEKLTVSIEVHKDGEYTKQKKSSDSKVSIDLRQYIRFFEITCISCRNSIEIF